MSHRIQLFFGRLFLLWLLVFKTAIIATAQGEEEASIPKFVLVEEHHHVVSHIVRFAREGVLQSHTSLPEEERSPDGAILIHIDSHADMGFPPGLNHLPAKKLFSNLPSEHTPEDTELLEHSVINDFLLLLGYMGIVEHVVFVEPPWSHLLKGAHYTTVDICMGVVPGKEGISYVSVRNSQSTIFPHQVLTEDAIGDLESMMDDPNEFIKIVPHADLLHYCFPDDCILRTVQFTTLPYQGAAEAIHTILNLKENKDRDIVLDIDLDGFSTTSPGALSLFHSTIPDYGVLTRIFHTVHGDICDMEKDYWGEQLKRTSGSTTSNESAENKFCESQNQSYSHGPSFRPPLGSPSNRDPSDRAFELVEDLWFYHKLEDDEDVVQALAEVFEYYLPAIDASFYGDEKFVELLDAFLGQPFYVPESETIEAILDFHFDHLFRTIFEDPGRRVPKVINVVRSPFYTPDHHLDFIECEVFDRLLEMFVGSKSTPLATLYHFEEVLVDRTNCLNQTSKSIPNRFSIGTNSNIDTNAWRETHETYSHFFEDDDEIVGLDYKHAPIFVDFVNEHNYPLLVKAPHGQAIHALPGQRLAEKVKHMTRWDIFEAGDEELASEPTKEPLLIIFFDGKKGNKQSYGSISGRIPVHHSTPVKMEVENPSGSGIHVALKTELSERSSERLAPGETITLQTVHGKRWTIHGVSEEDKSAGLEQHLGEVIANATFGEIHSILLFSDEGASGHEL